MNLYIKFHFYLIKMGCILSLEKENDKNEYEIVRVIDERTIDVKLKNTQTIQTVYLTGIKPYDDETHKRKMAIRVLTELFLQYRFVNLIFTNHTKKECRMNIITYPHLNVNDWLISRGHCKNVI